MTAVRISEVREEDVVLYEREPTEEVFGLVVGLRPAGDDTVRVRPLHGRRKTPGIVTAGQLRGHWRKRRARP